MRDRVARSSDGSFLIPDSQAERLYIFSAVEATRMTILMQALISTLRWCGDDPAGSFVGSQTHDNNFDDLVDAANW